MEYMWKLLKSIPGRLFPITGILSFLRSYDGSESMYYYVESLDIDGSDSDLSVYCNTDGKEIICKKCYDIEGEIYIYDVLKKVPGIVRVIEEGVFFDEEGHEVTPGDGAIFLERYEGDLRELLYKNIMKNHGEGNLGVPFILEDALPQMVRLLTALDIMHSLNICHNDIKPENIFHDSDGNMYIGDFDISIPYSEDEMELFLSAKKEYEQGVNRNYLRDLSNFHLPGTYIYSPPENLVLDKYNKQRAPKYPISDIWGLGCVFFEMLTSRNFNTNTFHVTNDGKGLMWKDIAFDHTPLGLLKNVTKEMNREGFSIYNEDWRSFVPKEDTYPATISVCAFQAHAVEGKTISEETIQHLQSLFKGMLDPNFLTRLSAKECLENPLFKDHLHISEAMREEYSSMQKI